jgi:hypothetical protein
MTKNWFLNVPRLTTDAGKKGPNIVEKVLGVVDKYGPYAFYRLKESWLQPLQG